MRQGGERTSRNSQRFRAVDTKAQQIGIRRDFYCYRVLMSRLSDFAKRVSYLEAAVEELQRCNAGNVTAIMRMKAQSSAVYSLLAEVTEQHGLPVDVLETHFRVRSEFYLDRLLSDAEKASPTIGALLDDREVQEVPEFDGYPPLFPRGDDLDNE